MEDKVLEGRRSERAARGRVRDPELAHIPIGRFGLVGEVAPTIAFLCTEQSSYTSGALFVIDGASDCY